MDFATRLNSVMKKRNITAGMLAIKTGISKVAINKYQKGDYLPGAYSLSEIAKALNVSTDWLLGIKEEEK